MTTPAIPRPLLVIDTNILDADPTLRGASWSALAAAIADKIVDVAVPEVVVRETARHLETRGKAARNQLIDALRAVKNDPFAAGLDLPELSYLPPATTLRKLPKPTVGEIRTRLRERLREIGCSIASLPSPTHDMLVDWSLSGHPPFDSTDKGYRDALIWFTACDLALADRDRFVILVTNDGDYSKKGTSTPHERLTEHLHSIDRKDSLVIARDIVDALKRAKDSRTDTSWWPPTVPHQVVNSLLTARLSDALDDLIGTSLAHSTPDGDWDNLITGFEIPAEADSPTITEIDFDEEDAHLEWTATQVGNTFAGDATVRAYITYEAYLTKPDFYSTDDETNDGWTLVDPDYNRHYVQVSRSHLVFFVATFAIDITAETLRALDITEMYQP